MDSLCRNRDEPIRHDTTETETGPAVTVSERVITTTASTGWPERMQIRASTDSRVQYYQLRLLPWRDSRVGRLLIVHCDNRRDNVYPTVARRVYAVIKIFRCDDKLWTFIFDFSPVVPSQTFDFGLSYFWGRQLWWVLVDTIYDYNYYILLLFVESRMANTSPAELSILLSSTTAPPPYEIPRTWHLSDTTVFRRRYRSFLRTIRVSFSVQAIIYSVTVCRFDY